MVLIMTQSYINDVQRVLNQMDTSEYKFYLTGSRFFGGCQVNESDYDFFVESTPQIVVFLYNLGFKDITASSMYKDSLIHVIMRHPTGIDVQVVNNIYLKIKAQALLKELGIFTWLTDKNYRRVLWDRAITCISICPPLCS